MAVLPCTAAQTRPGDRSATVADRCRSLPDRQRAGGKSGARNQRRCSKASWAILPPDHRAQRARFLVDHARRSSPEDDESTRKAVRYLRLLLGQEGRRRRSLPHFLRNTAAAYDLHRAGGIPRWHLEAQLLTGVSFSEAARACDLDESVVKTYADLFFDVANCLDAEDYISIHAVGHDPEHPLTPDGPEGLLKHAAYLGGPLVLEAVLHALTHPPLPVKAYAALEREGLRDVAADLRCRAWMLTTSLPLSFFTSRRVNVLERSLERLRRCARELASGGPSKVPTVPTGTIDSILKTIDLRPQIKRRRA